MPSDSKAPAAYPRLLTRWAWQSAVAEMDSWFRSLPGRRFGWFGRALGLRAVIGGQRLEGGALLLTPVNSVRYWEFDFADRHLAGARGRGLDVSSPRLLSFYFAHRRRFAQIEISNPDRDDTRVTRQLADACGLRNISTRVENAVEATSTSKFEAIWTISVLEHIPLDGDTAAVRSMFQALLPGGTLIITVPVDRIAWDEFRRRDTYSLAPDPEPDGTYFFQRYYDPASIRRRLIDAVGIEPDVVEWFGEVRPGRFRAYERRWRRLGFGATVADPSFVSRNFKHYVAWSDMPGAGVCGMRFTRRRRRDS